MTAKSIKVFKSDTLTGSIQVPGDKSISHRAIIFASIAKGTSRLYGLNQGQDVNATRNIFSQLGVEFEENTNYLSVTSPGIRNWKIPKETLEFDCENSGTTVRLLSGLFAGIKGLKCTMTGDASLKKRPMKRILIPLKKMGANVKSNKGTLPLQIKGTTLHGIRYDMSVASAQLKSSIMLAGLSADSKSIIIEPTATRNHTEAFFKLLNLSVFQKNNQIISYPIKRPVKAFDFIIPGDPSSAAFWIAAALITQKSDITLENVSLNPGRIVFLKILKRAGAHIDVSYYDKSSEPRGTIRVRSSRLKTLSIQKADIAHIIDEFPILALIASTIHATSIFSSAKELRFKESDRIASIVETLSAFGVTITETTNGFIIEGGKALKGNTIDPKHDHRIAMMASIAGLITETPVTITSSDVAAVSYPDFYTTLKRFQTR